MYPEFIAIYIMLAIVIALLGTVLFFLLKLVGGGSISSFGTQKNNSNAYYQQSYQQQSYQQQQYQQPYQQQQYRQQQYQDGYRQFAQDGRVVFCKNCATQYDAAQEYCPQCGTRRQ